MSIAPGRQLEQAILRLRERLIQDPTPEQLTTAVACEFTGDRTVDRCMKTFALELRRALPDASPWNSDVVVSAFEQITTEFISTIEDGHDR